MYRTLEGPYNSLLYYTQSTQHICRPSIQNHYESKKSTTTAATPNSREKECQ